MLEYSLQGSTLSFRWSNVVPGFDMPVRATIGSGQPLLLQPTQQWQTITLPAAGDFRIDVNFYVTAREVRRAPG